MPVNLIVEVNVKIGDDKVYGSTSVIPADTSCLTPYTVCKGQSGQEVYVEAGKRKWLRFFAINLPPLDNHQPYKGLSFRTSDDEGNESGDIPLPGPVAYWGKSLDQLFGSNQKIEKIIFSNDWHCDVEVTIYVGRDVAAHKPGDEPCPPKKP